MFYVIIYVCYISQLAYSLFFDEARMYRPIWLTILGWFGLVTSIFGLVLTIFIELYPLVIR